MDHLLHHANDTDGSGGGTMPPLTTKEILEGAAGGGTVAFTRPDYVTTSLSGGRSTVGAGAAYYDGKRRSRKGAKKNMFLTCQISPRRKRNASKH